MTRPLVILHGALGSAVQMAAVAAAFEADGGADVIEFAGHGATPRGTTEFSIRGFAGQLAEELTVRGLERPVVFGYSMGGYVALALEAAAPGTLGGIVTLGTKFVWTPETAAREVRRLDPAVLRAKIPAFADTLTERHAAGEGWESVLAGTAALLTDLGAHTILTEETLAALRVPVICAVGERDETVSAEETGWAAAACGGRTVLLPGIGHPIERVPAGTVVDLVRWLTDPRADESA